MTKTTILSLTALFAALSICTFDVQPAAAKDCVAWLQASAALEIRGRAREAAKARARYIECVAAAKNPYHKGAELILQIGISEVTSGNHGGGKGKGGKHH